LPNEEYGSNISLSLGTASKALLPLRRERSPEASRLLGLAWIASSKSYPGLRCSGGCPIDAEEKRRERIEQLTLRIVGACFLVLAAYVAYEALSNLIHKKAAEYSLPGIIIACASLVAMPLLSRAKRQVASHLRSAAMKADAKQTQFCTYLSAILLGGLLLNAKFALWWADPVAGLIMVPIIAKEGVEGLKGETCCD
jgi:hypothetical protein